MSPLWGELLGLRLHYLNFKHCHRFRGMFHLWEGLLDENILFEAFTQYLEERSFHEERPCGIVYPQINNKYKIQKDLNEIERWPVAIYTQFSHSKGKKWVLHSRTIIGPSKNRNIIYKLAFDLKDIKSRGVSFARGMVGVVEIPSTLSWRFVGRRMSRGIWCKVHHFFLFHWVDLMAGNY